MLRPTIQQWEVASRARAGAGDLVGLSGALSHSEPALLLSSFGLHGQGSHSGVAAVCSRRATVRA
eukprot:4928596-Alexandrium_andersonii.AAC.1